MSEPSPTDGSHGNRSVRDQTEQWAMLIHFSTLASWVVPILGLVLPLVLWQVKKRELPGIVPHAHVVMNWIVSLVIYWFLLVAFLVFMVFGPAVIRIPLGPITLVGLGLLLLAALNLLYAIVGGLKANEGTLWPYPGTLYRFFR